MRACACVCMRARACVCMRLFVHACVCLCVRTYAYMLCVRACVQVCARVCACAHDCTPPTNERGGEIAASDVVCFTRTYCPFSK
mmetsp:Transcript_52202/g.84400  ORF Transcript_52202/g.84400 Transcript_52202/m.84400 type:complete len:84 (-) Transcript_52202:830-1081(-)